MKIILVGEEIQATSTRPVTILAPNGKPAVEVIQPGIGYTDSKFGAPVLKADGRIHYTLLRIGETAGE